MSEAIQEEAHIPADTDVIGLIENAKEAFYDHENVIGIGIGHRRKNDEIHHDEAVLIIYVKEKLPADELNEEYLIPEEFQGLKTDVVAPFGPDTPQEALGITSEEGHIHSDDMSFLDWGRLHEQWMAEAGEDVEFHGTVEDFGDVCVIEDDGTLIQTINGQPVIDWVRAYKLFRTTHSDIYDFVTFFTDSAHGMPPQGGSSWYRFVHNDTQGIGLSSFNYRSAYGSNVLQGIMFLNQGHFPLWRYVMLQEQGHRWGSFARYRDSETGSNQNDHMLGGWGHWAYEFDDDDSAMDYDTYNWVADNGNFDRVSLTSDERGYCNLDLYLMGLLGPEEVGDFYLLSNLSQISGNKYSASKKRLTAQNIIWAEGQRTPTVDQSQKLFKNAFVVLTGDLEVVHDLVDRIDNLRLRFEDDFYEATKTLGRVDTTLGPLRGERLTSAQIKELTSRGYTDLHRHYVRPYDLRITGTQYQGTLDPGRATNAFTFNWPASWDVDWFARPTTPGGKIRSRLDRVDRSNNNTFTYWINVENVGNVRSNYDLKYVITKQ